MDREKANSGPYRQKRRQVAKACDSCRVHRIKCDNNQPCTNCKTRASHCSNSDRDETKTPELRQSWKEIAQLKQKIQDLELELQARHNILSPPASLPSSSPEPLLQSDNGEPKLSLAIKHWEGIQIQLRPALCSQATFFGPSSLYYYLNRFSVCLASSLRQSHSTIDSMLLQSASSGKLLESLSIESEEGQDDGHVPSVASPSTVDHHNSGLNLTATQEEYFLNHFWESYHTSLFAILDEAKFKKHHQSLWTSSSVRKPSALVDIVLAMCMQYTVSALPYSQQGVFEINDAAIAGRWYYRRCQTLLIYELESPTISTLQCHLLCAIYLCGGSFHNMVDSCSALAVRTAHTLGLHVEPPVTLSLYEREERRRLWWTVYVLDSKVSMKLGRPFMIHASYAMPSLPSDTIEAAMLSGSTFAAFGNNSTWLSFNLQNTKLYMTIRTGFSNFYEKELGDLNGQEIWENPQALKRLAEVMESHIKHLDSWIVDVPDGLKTKRQNNGQPFSTDGSALDIEKFAPLWLQRQRLLLEATYHHLCIDIYRPFITLVPTIVVDSTIERIATRCASHAIAFTKMSQQVLSSTSILAGWYEVFQWQFSATMALAGFVYTYPRNSLTPAGRSAIDLAVSVFDIFGSSLPVALSAAKIVGDLGPKLDFLGRQAWAADQLPDVPADLKPLSDVTLTQELPVGDEFWLSTPINFDSEYSNFDMTDSFLFDSAMGVEFWGDLNDLWPNADSFNSSWVA